MRERDLVARLGGDEFVVVLTDLGGRSGAVQRLGGPDPRSAGGADRRSTARPSGCGAAIGVATFPADGGDAADLLAHADRGMYADKGARNGSLR